MATQPKEMNTQVALADSLDEAIDFDKSRLECDDVATPLFEGGSQAPNRAAQEVGLQGGWNSASGTQIPVAAGELQPERFEVTLSKRGAEGFGFAHVPVSDSAHALLVVDVQAGSPIAAWNQAQRERGRKTQTVKEGDRIIDVSGAPRDLEQWRTRLRGDTVTFTVERWPRLVPVVLQKKIPSERFGMQTEVTLTGGQRELVVTAVDGGLTQEWNCWAYHSQRFYDAILPGMTILQVNEVRGDADAMQDALCDRMTVELTFLRPEPDELLDFRRDARRDAILMRICRGSQPTPLLATKPILGFSSEAKQAKDAKEQPRPNAAG